MPSIDELLAKGKKRGKPSSEGSDRAEDWEKATDPSTDLISTPSGSQPRRISRGVRPDHIARGAESHEPSEPNDTTGSSQRNVGQQIDSNAPLKLVNERESIDSNSTASRQQLDSNKTAVRQHLDSKSTAEKIEQIPLDSNKTADWTAARQQLDSKSTAFRQPLDSKIWQVEALSGKESDFLKFVYQRCKNSGSRETGNISSHTLCEALRVSTKRLRNLVERLIAKQVLRVSTSKRGNGSWRRFVLPEGIYREMALNDLDSRSTAIRQPLDSNKTADWTADKTAGLSSSSSKILDLKTTTTSETESSEILDAPWQEIDCSPLSEICFGQNHVRQIANAGKVTAEELQDSIETFAFDLNVNGKAKKLTGPPLNFFMGCLRKGPYAPPENYEAPDVRQRRLYLEAKEKVRKQRQEIEEKIEALEFEEWLERLSSGERATLVAPTDFARVGSVAHKAELRRHFHEYVWKIESNKEERHHVSAKTTAD